MLTSVKKRVKRVLKATDKTSQVASDGKAHPNSVSEKSLFLSASDSGSVSVPKTLSAEFQKQLTNKVGYDEDDLLEEFNPILKQEKFEKNDPLQAEFFDELMKDPLKENEKLKKIRDQEMARLGKRQFYELLYSDTHNKLKKNRSFDFRLDENELEKYKKNGFVVSERMAVESFAEAYYRTYTDDLPVFISADSILHAWHMSFSSLLQEVENYCLAPSLKLILSKMHDKIESLGSSDAVKDVDYFLCVAISLLDGKKYGSKLGMDSKVAHTLGDIERLTTSDVKLFGEERTVDFSQFKPRGHYTSSELLSNYFKAMMWLGRIDFRLCEKTEASRKQLQSSLMLLHLLNESEEVNSFVELNQILKNFVGEVDSLDVTSFSQIVGADLNLVSPSDAELDHVEYILSNQPIGEELIKSHVQMEEVEQHPTTQKRSFAFIGQRFTLDAFVFTNVTFDGILWEGEKVQRRRPSGLDVAFSVLGNDAAALDIVRSIKSTRHNSWRDGKKYAHNLAALRVSIDKLPESYWNSTVYTLWLNALRALSRTPDDVKEEERKQSLFHSEAWQKRVINTQLGSWSELKHDTVLYSKQAYGCMTCCEYAAGIVEPVPEFFSRMRIMVETTKELIKQSSLYKPVSSGSGRYTYTWNPKEKHTEFLDQFSGIMSQLEEVCILQRQKKPLSDEQNRFLGDVMEERHGSGASRYLGWYPKLFFAGRETSGEFKPRVADVFTAPCDVVTGDRGGVVHVGVGKVFQAILAVGGVAYVGPVFSFYEFETGVDERLNDEEWEKRLKNNSNMPSLPEWATESFVQQEQ